MANETQLIPSDPSSKVDLIPTATITSSNVTGKFNCVAAFTSAILQLTTTAAAGTSRTLNVYIQTLLPDGATWCDLAAFTQVTGNTTRVMGIISGGSSEFAKTDATLTAGSFNAIPLGSMWRVKYVVGGSSPSFSVTLAAEFFV